MSVIEIIGSAGPHCSTRFEDRRAEMLAPDYEPQTVPRFVVDEWRERELAARTEPWPADWMHDGPRRSRPPRTASPAGPPWQSRPGPGG